MQQFNEQRLMSMPKAHTTEFELSDKECKLARQRIYAINKDGIRRFRTLREGRVLVVWRMK